MTDVEFKLALNERLCDLVELMLHQYNPCNQQDGGCVAGKPNPCCTNTRFGKTGCPFFDGKCKVRLIWCKYWLCEIAIRNTKPECVEVLKHIQEIQTGMKEEIVNLRIKGNESKHQIKELESGIEYCGNAINRLIEFLKDQRI